MSNKEAKKKLEACLDKDYNELLNTLFGAYDQASVGKGKVRHAGGKPFLDQPIMWIEDQFKSYQLGQAVKKIHESQILPIDAAIHELRGAIVYLSAHILHLQKGED